MSRREEFTVGQIIASGIPYGAVTVLEKNEVGYITRCKCATGSIPSAVAGYAVGCILIDTTTGHIYVNTNTTASCTFNDVGAISAGEISLANGKYLVGGATNVAEAKTVTNANTTPTNQTTVATNQAATATNQNTSMAKVFSLGSPAAADTTSVVANVNLANGAQIIAAQPDVPRTIQVKIVDTTPSITAGTVTIDGTDALDAVIQDVVDCSAGAGTFTTVKAFKTITAITAAAFSVLGGAGDEKIECGFGLALGVAADIADTVGIAFAAGVAEAATVSATNNTVVPTTALGGVVFSALLNVNHLHVQDSHNHTQDTHNHTQDAHTHTINTA